jgi:alpha-L-fucosidase
MQQYGSSIYGTRGAVMPAQDWGVVTAKEKNWYLHILHQPREPYIFIPQVKDKVSAVTLLNGGSSVHFKQQSEGVFVYLDNIRMDDIDTILQVSF